MGMTEYIVRYENEYLQLLPDKMQELVRCKDCKYGTEKSGNIICHNPTHDEYETDIRPFDWFCADGEKDS